MGLILPRNPLVFPGRGAALNLAHPMAQGARYAGVAMPGGSFFDLLRAKNSTQVNDTFTTAVQPWIGPAASCPTSTAYNSVSNSFSDAPTAVNIAALFIPTGVTACLFGSAASWIGATNTGVSVTNSGVIQCALSGNTVNSTLSATTNEPYFVGFSCNNANVQNYVLANLHTGKVVTGSTANTNSIGSGSSHTFSVAGSSFGSRTGAQVAAAAYSINNFLSIPQLLALAATPFDYWFAPVLGQTIFAALGGVSHATLTAVGEADGSSSVSGVGTALLKAAGEADGSASVSGASAQVAAAAGEAEGSADVSGASALVAAAVGEADGSADVSGAALITIGSVGEADGSSDVIGIGASSAAPISLPVLPGLGFPVHRRPTFRTIVAKHPSGTDRRTALWSAPLWEFEITFDGLSASATDFAGLNANSLQTLLGFYLAIGGPFGSFQFVDPDFNTCLDQPIGVGDGSTTIFPFLRRIWAVTEPVSIVTGSPTVHIGAAVSPPITGWNLSPPNLIQFVTAPADGAIITADFTYAFLCRFLDDSEDFEQLMIGLWDIKQLKFRQVRTSSTWPLGTSGLAAVSAGAGEADGAASVSGASS